MNISENSEGKPNVYETRFDNRKVRYNSSYTEASWLKTGTGNILW